ncbi:MAG: cobalamin biosynthesis protein CobD [Planctomycetota bacterium]|nr:cobalamin biosynthesis protein CobD [Planctomycetota bacterium]
MTLDPWTLWSLPLGAVIDAVVGDPRGWPHPVRWIGRGITEAEHALRAPISRVNGRATAERTAGVVLVLLVVISIGGAALGLVAIANWFGGPLDLVIRALMIHFGLAARSLRDEALRASEAPDLAAARRELMMIVGRDTADLEWPEVCRACVETVAENSNDGVIAAIFWYAVGGPVGLWIYKSVNTLDSMVGYRNPRYRDFGWASARLDDVMGFLPARLTWLLMGLSALILGERPLSAIRLGWRDGRNHPSPNSAWSEAAMAGALGIQLGGMSTFAGIASPKPLLGDPGDPIDPRTVRRAVRVMLLASWIAIAIAWGVRTGLFGRA